MHLGCIQLVNGLLPDGYNKLNVSFAVYAPDAPALDDQENEIVEGVDNDECVKNKDLQTQDKGEILERDKVEDGDEDEPEEKGRSGKFQ